MVLTESDRYLIRALREEKKMSLNQILREFPGRHWKKSTVADFLKRLKATGSIERRPGSGRKRKVSSPEKVQIVQKLICSKDSATGKNMSIRKIASLTGVSRTMVSNIASNDLGIKPAKKKVTVQARMKQRAVRETRLELCKNLLKRFHSKESLKTVWFSGEKRFSVEKPSHGHANESERDDPELASASEEKKCPEKSSKHSSKVVEDGTQSNLIHPPNANSSCGSANGELSSGNNVMHLLNNYVLNPIHFGCNSTYLAEQNSSYANNSSSHFSSASGNYAVESHPNSYGAGNYPAHQCIGQNDANGNGLENARSSEDQQQVQSVSNSLIVSIGVSVAGKSEPIFFEGQAGNISSECYKKNVLSQLLPFINAKTPDFCFIHDRSTAFRSQNTIRYLEENTHDFIRPNEWPSKCPQLNPVDYFVWKKLHSSVYKGKPIADIRELKERIISCWNDISQKSVNTAIYQWINKLRAVVNNAKD